MVDSFQKNFGFWLCDINLAGMLSLYTVYASYGTERSKGRTKARAKNVKFGKKKKPHVQRKFFLYLKSKYCKSRTFCRFTEALSRK